MSINLLIKNELLADDRRLAPKNTFQAFRAGRHGVNVSAENVDFPMVLQRLVKEMWTPVFCSCFFGYEHVDFTCAF